LASLVQMALLSKGSLYATFRETFWKSAALADSASDHNNDQSPPYTSSSSPSPRKPGHQPKALKALDLRALPRDDGPPTELRARRNKFAFFEQQCSEVDQGLFLGSDAVARNWDTLEAAGITHVVNCVGFIYPAYFEDRLAYKILYLQGGRWSVRLERHFTRSCAHPASRPEPQPSLCYADTPGEDITCVLYDTFDFIKVMQL